MPRKPGKRPAPRARKAAGKRAPGRRAAEPGAGKGPFPVVAIGASAGGLKALQGFLSGIPADCGLGFCVIQHLDPTHRSNMAELLGRHTGLTVSDAEEGTRLTPGHVYTIPPNTVMVIADGTLHLHQPLEKRGARMPIDAFFRSLAEERQERAIGVVLSGTGSDGTLGLRAIKAAGGLCVAQDPDTAEHDGMPRSAITTGLVDYILPVERMGDALLKFVRHPYITQAPPPDRAAPAPDGIQAILALLRARIKFDFAGYRRGTLARRIQRRMGLRHIVRFPEYLQYLRDHPAEVQDLFKDLLISVTAFFREPEAWRYLADHVVPRIVPSHDEERPVRVWVPGCATGEEAYSAAMVILEKLDALNLSIPVQVFASDLDRDVLEQARMGIYPESIAAELSPERLRRFFIRRESGAYQVCKQLRESVVFAQQNVLVDPPFSRLDLITCRNLLIYLEPETQRRLMSLFHFALRENGFLFLGNAESVPAQQDLFESVSRRWRVYRRIGAGRPERVEFPAPTGSIAPRAPTVLPPMSLPLPAREAKVGTAVQDILLERFIPASVVVNPKGEILYQYGPTGRFLEPPRGRVSSDLLRQVSGGLRSHLRNALRQAGQTGERVTTRVTRRKGPDGGQLVTISVEQLHHPPEAGGLLLVVLEEQPLPDRAGTLSAAEERLVSQLEYELRVSQEELRTTTEQLATSNEEYKAANEEMMSMNEELQSTNEELETSKEELQSLNEELSTVNSQLEAKVAELEQSNNDLANLINNTEIGTLFLDLHLRVRRFTPALNRLMRLIPADIGRSIGDVRQRFQAVDLYHDAQAVLERLTPIERQVRSEEGSWYLCRLLPYRTEDHQVGGIIITFVDITDRRLAESRRFAETILATTREPVLVLRTDLQVYAANRAFLELVGRPNADVEGAALADIAALLGSDETLIASARRVIDGAEVTTDIPLGRDIGDGRHALMGDIQPLKLDDGGPDMILLVLRDVSRQQEESNQARQNQMTTRELLREFLRLQEEERRGIARELHDQVGQYLTAIGLALKSLQGRTADDPALAGLLDHLREMTGQLSRRTHTLALELRPPELDQLGLVHALESYLEERAEHAGLQVSLDASGLAGATLPPETETTLFRVLQEALTNVIQHAHANAVQVSLSVQDGTVTMLVRDDGSGFDAAAVLAGRGPARRLGILGMEERVSQIGGSLTVESASGAGATVRVAVPVEGSPPPGV